MSSRTQRLILIIILVLAVLLRIGVALYAADTVPPGTDEFSYSTLAARLATGHGYSFSEGWYPFTPADTPTSHWSFLYTGFVGAVYAVFGPHPLTARLMQAMLVGLLMPWLTYRLARRIMHLGARNVESEVVPLIAAGLSAAYGYFVLYGAMVQTEALFICAVLWSLERALAIEHCLHPRAQRHAQDASTAGPPVINQTCTIRQLGLTALTFGLSLGTAALLRQSILPWVGVMFLYLLACKPQVRDRERLRTWKGVAWLIAAGGVMVICILPFTVRNYRVYNEFLMLNSNAGYAMYSAQHPIHGTHFQPYAAAPLPADLLRQDLNEAQWDRALMRRGILFVTADPVRYLRLSLSRAADYFIFWPTADSSLLFNAGRILSWGLFLPFMLYGIVLALGRGHTAELDIKAVGFLLLFAAVHTLVHLLTWSMQRYRLPVDAVLLLFAALALRDLALRVLVRLRATRHHSDGSTDSVSRAI